MAYGKPVIATGWSGNMDFMNVSNSYPVRYELVEIKKGAGQYRAGEVWAEPSVWHAAELMRRVYDNPAEARERGLAARRDIETYYSEERVAELIRRRLKLIGCRSRFATLRRRLMRPVEDVDSFLDEFEDLGALVPSRHLEYRRLVSRVRAAASRSLPPGAPVAVVSRGDPQLLRLDGLRAGHFPRAEGGAYAGHHPADGPEAVRALEQLRLRGEAAYVLLPQTSFWWLDYYPEFREHLENNCRLVMRDDETCAIYELGEAKPAFDYAQCVRNIREVVRKSVPPEATVIVVSRGDGELLNLEGRRAWHFPQAEGGVYAGHHPADAAAAIKELEALRDKGGDHFLLPGTSFWWMDYYGELKSHLESRYRLLVREEGACLIYALGGSAPPGGPRAKKGKGRATGKGARKGARKAKRS
jgi:hypothetical protein